MLIRSSQLLKTIGSALTASLLLSAPAAWAFDTHFGVNPAVSLQQLESNATTSTSSGRNGNIYWADASAVLHADAAKLFAAAQDYDRYVEFGMPHLNDSHVVERDSPELLFTWASMSIITLHSQHYLEVLVHPSLGADGSRGMEWQLAPKKPEWPYVNAPGFTRSDGSFYIQPLQDGTVYVRYYLSNDVDVPLGGLLSGVIQSQLRKGAADVIMVLARQAAN
jgi:hypothetical protein